MVIYNQKETREHKKEDKKMMYDDFDTNVTCEEVYTEDGYVGCEPEPTEWEAF